MDCESFVRERIGNEALRLLERSASPQQHGDAMYQLGEVLAARLMGTMPAPGGKKVCLVSTAEDADYLARGVYDSLRNAGLNVYFVCMWNHRDTLYPGGVSVAPIIRQFHQPGFESCEEVVVLKSVILGACVVKTNITALLARMKPRVIHVMAPVIHAEAQESLRHEFPAKWSSKFRFHYLACDQQTDGDGNLSPGIGGNVYHRLGFAGQDDKNQHLPRMVRMLLNSSSELP